MNYFRTKKSKPSSSIPDLQLPIISKNRDRIQENENKSIKKPVNSKPVKNKVEYPKNLIPDLPKFIGIPSLPSKSMAATSQKTRETTESLPDIQVMAGNSKVKKNESDFEKKTKRKDRKRMAGNSKNIEIEIEESAKKKRKRDKNQYETITIE